MKRLFTPRKPRKKTQELIERINVIVNRYQADGRDLTLRQLYYQLVSVNAIPNTENNYKRLSSIVNDGRMAGMIDWAVIVDRGRGTQQRSVWDSPADIIRACVTSYGEDLWANRLIHLELICEKQALSGVLWPVCEEFSIPFTAIKGFSSVSLYYTVAERIADKSDNEGKQIVILYLGDHDPSGQDMSRDCLNRLSILSGVENIQLERLGLNASQVAQYNLMPQPTKKSDSRAKKFIADHGEHSYELDALQPDVIEQLARDGIARYLDPALWEEAILQQEFNRGKLAELAEATQ